MEDNIKVQKKKLLEEIKKELINQEVTTNDHLFNINDETKDSEGYSINEYGEIIRTNKSK